MITAPLHPALGSPQTSWPEGSSGTSDAAGWSEALGFGGRVALVPPERHERWCAEGLEQLEHAGERQGCELLVGWSREPSPRALRSWAARLARRAPLRRFVHVLLSASGSGLVAMASPSRLETREVVVRALDDDTRAAIARIDAHHREHLVQRLLDVLGREEVTRRFFRRFRHHLGRVEAAWTGLPAARLDARARHDLAMTTLCRLMFVTFLARSGRLEPIDSPRWLVEQPRRGSLYRDVLRPVFFEVLNTSRAERGDDVNRFSVLPFLNGGLFEPLELERDEALDVADAPLLAAIDELFEGYDFASTERDPERSLPAIDPEMLGQVFEALMNAEERRSSGTFFTPAHLVRRLVRDAFGVWAERRRSGWGSWVRAVLRGDQADPLPTDEAVSLDRALADLRIVDPAVGSGAFLLGARDALVELRARLREPAGQVTDRYALARRAVTHNLFGVDRSLAAVRLCELRLWLSLVVEAPTDRPLEPLPNLDHHIRQGDSLSGFRGGEEPADRGRRPEPVEPEPVEPYAELHGLEKSRRARELRRAELQRLGSLVADERARVTAWLDELERAVTSPDLFGESRPPTEHQRRERRRLEGRLAELDQARRSIARGELASFSYRAAFSEVAARGGFDLVVGNPPWVRLHDVGPSERRRLRERFGFCRGLGSGFHAQVDLSTAFLERSFDLVAPAGIVALLLPVKLFRARYGRRARQALIERFTVHHFADLSLQRSRLFAASSYPAWLVASRDEPTEGENCVATCAGRDGRWTSDTRPATELPQGDPKRGPWVALPREAMASLELMREGRVTLREYGLEPSLGLKTGRNPIFLAERWEQLDGGRLELDMSDGTRLVVPVALAPLACRGRDLAAFAAEPTARVLAAYDRETPRPLRRVPPDVRAYFEGHRRSLRARRDAASRAAPWRLFRTRALRPGRKVIWRDIAPRLEAVCCDDDDIVPLNTAYFVEPADAHEGWVLAAILNSRWARLYTAATAEPAMSGYSRFLAFTVGRLPWPGKLRLGSRTARELERLSREAHDLWTPDGQAEIDDRLAWAWGLSEAARRALRPLEGFFPAVTA